MGITRELLFIPVLLILGELFQEVSTQQCNGEAEYSVTGMMLQRHIYKKMRVSFGYDCLQACHQDITCQSFNYVISQSVCEFSDRTKEARPEDYMPNSDRYYLGRERKRGKVRKVQ